MATECSICYDNVTEKEPPGEPIFGLLENCDHVFCWNCIQRWHAVHRECPFCKIPSSVVVRSGSFLTGEEKAKLVEEELYEPVDRLDYYEKLAAKWGVLVRDEDNEANQWPNRPLTEEEIDDLIEMELEYEMDCFYEQQADEEEDDDDDEEWDGQSDEDEM